ARHATEVFAIAALPDGKFVTGGKDMLLRVHDLAGGKETGVFRGHLSWVRGVAASSDGKRLASVGYDNPIRLWDGPSPVAPAAVSAHDVVQAIAFDPAE